VQRKSGPACNGVSSSDREYVALLRINEAIE
jgi:hypothetical protein